MSLDQNTMLLQRKVRDMVQDESIKAYAGPAIAPKPEPYAKCEMTVSLLQALGWLLIAAALAIAAYRFSSPEWAAAAKAWGG